MKTSLTMKVIFLALLVETGRAQSGFEDEGERITCWSHISVSGNSFTCRVTDEDEEDGTIERISMCFSDLDLRSDRCLDGGGASLTSPELNPLTPYNVSVSLRNSAPVSFPVDLKDLVKPRNPTVWNVTQNQDTKQVLIHIWTPYLEDYLTLQNQRFQVALWTGSSQTVLNLSNSDVLALDLDLLEASTQYQARVRAIPQGSLRGTWSDWSATYGFSTAARRHPGPEGSGHKGSGLQDPSVLLVCTVLIFATLLAVFLFWKHKIYRLMWPQIPKPSPVQIQTSTRGLLLHFSPENFSPLILEKQHSCSSASWKKEQQLLSSPGATEGPAFGVKGAEGSGTREDTYVTMSNFYQGQ